MKTLRASPPPPRIAPHWQGSHAQFATTTNTASAPTYSFETRYDFHRKFLCPRPLPHMGVTLDKNKSLHRIVGMIVQRKRNIRQCGQLPPNPSFDGRGPRARNNNTSRAPVRSRRRWAWSRFPRAESTRTRTERAASRINVSSGMKRFSKSISGSSRRRQPGGE